jgi:hypothetical protein
VGFARVGDAPYVAQVLAVIIIPITVGCCLRNTPAVYEPPEYSMKLRDNFVSGKIQNPAQQEVFDEVLVLKCSSRPA